MNRPFSLQPDFLPGRILKLGLVLWMVAALVSACTSDSPPSTQTTLSATPAPLGQPTSSTLQSPTPVPALREAPQATALPEERQTSSATPNPTLTPSATPTTWLDVQQQALLPEALPEMQGLPALNHYDLKVSLDLLRLTFQGSLVLDYTNTETTSLNWLYFRLLPNGGASFGNGSLVVPEVKVNGAPATTQLSLSNSVMEVALPEDLNPGASVQVEMTFKGSVPADFGGGETAYGIYNYSEGVLVLSGWYPVLAVYDQDGWNLDPVSAVGDSLYSDMALYSVEVSVEEKALVVATGRLVEKVPGEVETRWEYASGPVRDFFIVASPDLQVTSQVSGETTVNSYYLPGWEAGGEAALEVAVRSLQLYNRQFGLYPYTEFDVVQAPMRNAGGVEFPGIVLIEEDRYKDPQGATFQTTVAHETAHQWWYNVVGNDIFDEPWLDEALATYSAGLYFQDAFGQDGYDGVASYWQSVYDQLVELGRDDLVTRGLSYFEQEDHARLYGAVVYIKGALFFYNLRKEIGDQAFFEALQDYYTTYEFRTAHGEDLLAAFEKASGKDLEAFYQEWLTSAR